MSSGCKFLKGFLRLILLLGIIVLLLIVCCENGETRTRNYMKHVDDQVNMGRRGKHRVLNSKFKLNYISRRRVPNGPDPIHNRRAGNSHQPPGQA